MTWAIERRTVLITGGNSGIGKAAATALAAAGADVVITTRDLSKGRAAAAEIEATAGNSVEVMRLDLADLDAVRSFAAAFEVNHADLGVLINNAGGVFGRRRETTDGFEMTLGTNHLGPFLLTNLLTPLLVRSAPSRVINVASSAHAFAKEGLHLDDLMITRRRYRQKDAYGQSKLANILHARELNRRLADSGVTAYAVHPGVVATNFGRDDSFIVSIGIRLFGYRFRTADEGAATVVFVATDPDVTSSAGAYFEDSAPTRSSRHAKDDAQAFRLWEISTSLVDRV
jgi:NAD(P)-dependent dehydrogenase (short-subunit alcohol dehydrogenase family)